MSMNSSGTTSPSRHGVDPPYLVVTNKTALPQRCIVTNEPVSDSEYQVWDLPSIPRWVRVTAVFSPLLLIAVPFVRWRCKIKVGVSKEVRRRRMLIKLGLGLVILSPFLFLAAALLTKRPEFLLATVVMSLLPYIAFPILVLRSPLLRVHRQKDEIFWIVGCSPEFLASIEAHV